MVARSVSCLTSHPSGKIDGSEVLMREPETGCSVIYVRVVHIFSFVIGGNPLPLGGERSLVKVGGVSRYYDWVVNIYKRRLGLGKSFNYSNLGV